MSVITGGHRRRSLVLAAAAAVAMLAAGCAHTTSTSGSSGGSGSGTAPMTLKVGQISNSVAFLPFYIAEHNGYFAQEHLNIGTPPRLGTGAKTAAALESGSIDVAGAVLTDALNLYKTNNKARVIGALVNTYYVDIIAGSTIPTADDSLPLIQRIKALKGKKIGITGPGSGTQALVDYLFKMANLNPTTDVTLVNLGGNATAAIGALKQHRIDALSFFQPVGQLAVGAGAGRLYISPARGDVPDLKGATQGIVMTTQSVIDKKGKAVAAFLRAIAKAEALIHNDPSAVGALLAGYETTMKPATVQALVPVLEGEIPASPLPEQAGYDSSSKFQVSSGLVPSAPPFADIVPTSWITSALNG